MTTRRESSTPLPPHQSIPTERVLLYVIPNAVRAFSFRARPDRDGRSVGICFYATSKAVSSAAPIKSVVRTSL